MNSLTLVFFHLLLATAFRLNDAAGCPGCSSPVENSNSEEIRKLMSSTLSKTNAGYTVTDVKNCKIQIIAGMKYDCEVDIKSPSGVPATCRLVVVQKPWDKNEKEQIVEETCSSVSRTKREVCAGCPVDQDANSSDMKKKLTGILSQTNSGLSLVRGTKCSSQVVAGIKYSCNLEVESSQTNGVQKCELEFVEQPWMSPDPTIIKDTCSKLVSNKREVCAGCPMEQDANSAEMKKKLTFILGQTNSGLSLVRGNKCSSQIVSGVKYVCTIEVESPKTNGVQSCKLTFLEQPWLNPDPQVIKDTCSQLVRNKREVCAGCPVEHDAHDPEVEQKIKNTLSQTNSGLGLVSVEKCTTQVVAGALYKCTIRVNSSHFNGIETCKLELLEQPWVSKEPQVVKDTCSQLGHAKRELLGGLKDVDSNEKVLVQELATYAVSTLDDIDADSNKRLVAEVIRAQKQLVNGIMYYLKLRVRTTSCDENKEINDDCVAEDASPQKLCDIQVYRSFADKSPLNAKVVKSECEPVTDVMKLGGYEPVQTNGEEVQNAAKFAAKRISEMINSITVKRLMSIESAATKVVSGVNYKMTLVIGDTDCLKNNVNKDSVCKFLPHAKTKLICEVEVYEKPWESVMKLISNNCQDVPVVSVERIKRALLGGYVPVKTNDDNVQEVAHFAQSKINDMVNSIYVKKVAAIDRAETQVVSGTNFALTLRLQDTDCMKNRPYVNSDCHVLSDSQMDLLCSVVIYKNLNNELSMTESKCKDVPRIPSTNPRNKRDVVGGASNIDVNSSEVTSLFPLVSREVTQRTNSPNLMRVTNTISASKQVVAGLKYTLKVEVSSTECPASVNTDPQTCHVAETPMKQICDITIWSKPWMKFQEITSFNCEENEKDTEEEKNDKVFKRSEEGTGDKNSDISFADEELERLAEMLETNLKDEEFHQFATFLASYEKIYPSEQEYKKRFRVFRANMKKVKYLQDTEQGTGEYGATEFADLTKSEFKKHYLGFKVEEGRWPQRPQAVIPNVSLPLEYDWRDFGAVTKVKNQGLCGSCWAFSITGNIEGQYAIKNKQLLSLSEQELVDCDKYDSGCNGGFFDSAFHALEDLGGLETESEYPYEGIDDKCRFNSSMVKVSITGSLNISSDETQMAKWLYKNGPISVAVNANAMQFYMGGVSHPLKFLCSPDNLDHGVLVVGFGVHKTMFLKRHLPYWIVKNSWGSGWGKQGYYWLYRGDGSCGINKMPTSAIL